MNQKMIIDTEIKDVIDTEIKDIKMKFESSSKLFSPKSIDKGTLAMLSLVDFYQGDRVLDLGCGYGVVGILSAKILGPDNVVMIDCDPLAVEYSKKNAELNDVEGIDIFVSDGFKNCHEKNFTMILSNTPYHVDFSVPKEFIEKGFNRLSINGKMFMVTKRKEWYKNKFISVFGGVKIWEVDDYYIFMAIKKSDAYAKTKKKNSKRKKAV